MNVLLALLCVVSVATSLRFSCARMSPRPTLRLLAQKKPAEKPSDEKKSKLTFGGVIQLMAMGAGAPMLGEFKEVDENGKMMFELEANNYLSELRSKNFNEGWVEDSKDAINKPPGFFKNLLSGGKLQEEWDALNRKK